MAATCFVGTARFADLPRPRRRPGQRSTIYFVDVEGCQRHLFVSALPHTSGRHRNFGSRSGESATPIASPAAAKDARLTQIDHLITTHWHVDHFGGLTEVANRIPIRELHRPRS